MLRKKSPGFTLIEIVIVLAIAALIMVIVFLAVQGAQRSRRDTQRKRDLDDVAAQLIAYSSTNKGKYPTTGSSALFVLGGPWNGAFQSNSFVQQYLLKNNPSFKDPNGASYGFANTSGLIPIGTAPGSSVLNACSTTGSAEDQTPTGSKGAGISYAADAAATRYQVRICLEQGEYFKDSAQ